MGKRWIPPISCAAPQVFLADPFHKCFQSKTSQNIAITHVASLIHRSREGHPPNHRTLGPTTSFHYIILTGLQSLCRIERRQLDTVLSFLCVSTITRVMIHVSKQQSLFPSSEKVASIRRRLCDPRTASCQSGLKTCSTDALGRNAAAPFPILGAWLAAITWENGDDPSLTMPEIPPEYFISWDAGTLRVCNELYIHSRGKITARLCKLLIMRSICSERDVIISARRCIMLLLDTGHACTGITSWRL